MTPPRPAPPPLAQPFFATGEQRVALARDRFFDQGARPSGLVAEPVIQSWSRCLQSHRDPGEAVAFNAVTRSRIHSVLSQNRVLLDVAADEFINLHATLTGTHCQAVLTDASGVVLHATHSAEPHERVLPLAMRTGVNLAEESVGTTAPGMVVRTGQLAVVRGAEHYFRCLQAVQCAAAPIRDIHQQVVGVLDVSVEGLPFTFDAAAMVGLHATAIENKLLQAQSRDHIVIRLHTIPSLLGTLLEGLAGVDGAGRVAWVNGAAARLLGLATPSHGGLLRDALGLEPPSLAALTRLAGPTRHRLPNGLSVWLVARLQGADGAARVFHLGAMSGAAEAGDGVPVAAPTEAAVPMAPAAVANTAPAAASGASLREADRLLVQQQVDACGGNIAKAARLLGVSRGLVYRRLGRQAPGRGAGADVSLGD